MSGNEKENKGKKKFEISITQAILFLSALYDGCSFPPVKQLKVLLDELLNFVCLLQNKNKSREKIWTGVAVYKDTHRLSCSHSIFIDYSLSVDAYMRK